MKDLPIKRRCPSCGWLKFADEFSIKTSECRTCKQAQNKDVKYGYKHRRSTREADFRKLMDISREQARFPGEE